ncbi:MAG: PspC domain-containing protein [Paludibacteraceae bacterium]|nr:PspC domain-containing protein [Paludibacteraceae bacterium]
MEKKLKKSLDKKIWGICGGIAEYFGWEKSITRAIYAILTLCGGAFPGLIIYLVLYFVMPEAENE